MPRIRVGDLVLLEIDAPVEHRGELVRRSDIAHHVIEATDDIYGIGHPVLHRPQARLERGHKERCGNALARHVGDGESEVSAVLYEIVVVPSDLLARYAQRRCLIVIQFGGSRGEQVELDRPGDVQLLLHHLLLDDLLEELHPRQRRGYLVGEHRHHRLLLHAVPVAVAFVSEKDHADALLVMDNRHDQFMAGHVLYDTGQDIDRLADQLSARPENPPANAHEAERFHEIEPSERFVDFLENLEDLLGIYILIFQVEDLVAEYQLDIIGLEDLREDLFHPLLHRLGVHGCEKFVAQILQLDPRALLPHQGFLGPLLETHQHGLEGDDKEDDEQGLDKFEFRARIGQDEPGELLDDYQVEQGEHRRCNGVEQALSRYQPHIEELVLQDHVGYRSAPDDQRRVDKRRRDGPVDTRPREVRDDPGERICEDRYPQPGKHDLRLPPLPRRQADPHRNGEQDHREDRVHNIHQREHLVMRLEEKFGEDVERFRQAVRIGRQGARGHRQIGDPVEEPGGIDPVDKKEDHQKMEYVGQEENKGESPEIFPDRILFRVYEGHQEQGREEELPGIIEALDDILEEVCALRKVSLDDDADGTEDRADTGKEHYEGRGPRRDVF